MKAVIYARFSTDKQSDSSIDDQARNCARYAERYGAAVVGQYADRAISGSSKDRPEFLAMLDAATRGEFDTLLVDDLSRLSRKRTETMQIIERFKFRSIRIVGVSDGYDSAARGEKIQSTMRGLMNELYLDDLREKTHRGMYGKALNGYSAGGRSYGYKRVPIENPTKLDPNGRPEIMAVRREINEDEARWVRQIFEWFASGHSPLQIADKLNKMGVSSTRGSTWAANAIYGDVNEGTGLLNNQLYIGKYIWNRSAWEKDPDTGKRKRKKRNESEWVVTDMPELRIVPQPLWEAVRARQCSIRERSVALRKALNNPKTSSRTGKYLFSGLLQCGCCGASYTVYGVGSYGCSTNINRGDSVCSNRLRVSRRLLEKNLLTVIQEELLSEEAIELFVKETALALKERQSDKKPEYEIARRILADSERQITNIVAAIRAGIITPTTKAELERAEAERSKAEATLRANTGLAETLTTILPRAAERYRGLVDNLGKALYTDVAHARQCLKALLGHIRLLPSATNKRHLNAELRHSLEGLMQLGFNNDCKVRLVAGARFELTTFRL